jgi:hypothetical protein
LFAKYLLGTVASMTASPSKASRMVILRADKRSLYAREPRLDGVLLPYDFLETLSRLLESMPVDLIDGCLDDAQSDI